MSDPFNPASSFRPGQPGRPLRPGQEPESGLIGEIQSEVSVEAAPLLTFVLTHAKVIVSLITLFVIGIAGFGVYQWQTGKTLQAAHLELGRILISPAGPAQVAALETFLPKAPASLKNGVLLELASSAVAAGDLAKAASAYGQLYTADPKGALGLISALNQADLLQREGQFDKAISLLEALEGGAPDALKTTVREELASLAEQAGQTEKALKTYEKLLTPDSGALPAGPESAYYKARINALKARASQKS